MYVRTSAYHSYLLSLLFIFNMYVHQASPEKYLLKRIFHLGLEIVTKRGKITFG